ncbi:MAG: hypothetical protein ABJF23_27365 [Bryobacteraceae bacterium]
MPALSLNLGRSAGEDGSVKSGKSNVDKDTAIDNGGTNQQPQAVLLTSQLAPAVNWAAPAPRAVPAGEPVAVSLATPQAPSGVPVVRTAAFSQEPTDSEQDHIDPDQMGQAELSDAKPAPAQAVAAAAAAPTSISLPVTAPVPTPILSRGLTRDGSLPPVRSRSTPELSTDSRQSPAPPLAFGKVRAEGPPSTEPMAFAARITEHDEPEEKQPAQMPAAPRAQKQVGVPPPSPAENRGEAALENVPTNPKPATQAAAPQLPPDHISDRARTEPVESTKENVPTNPKPVSQPDLAVRQTATHGPENSTKASVSQEARQSAPVRDTDLQTKPTIRSEPAREISIRIPSSGGNSNVEVQIVERDGKVQVSVRGSDNQLNSALRSDLAELVHTLDQKGYKTETWTPSETYPISSAKGPEAHATRGSESSPDGSGNQQSGGGEQGNPGGNQQQRRQHQERPDWLMELERRLDNEG